MHADAVAIDVLAAAMLGPPRNCRREPLDSPAEGNAGAADDLAFVGAEADAAVKSDCAEARSERDIQTNSNGKEKNGGGVTRNRLRETNSAPARPGYANHMVPAGRPIKLKSSPSGKYCTGLNSGRHRPPRLGLKRW